MLAHGFDWVSVWIDHECREVGWPVMRPKARTAIIGATRVQRFRMEGFNRGARRGIEGEMKTGAGRLDRTWLLLEGENVTASRQAEASRTRRRPDPR